jgi:lysophospholipase L1-like esterase
MRDSLDYIIIIAGHNDADLLDSMGIKTYKKRASELCKGLITRYPNAEIFWFTCWNNENPHFLQVVDATIQVCKKYHIPVFDAARNSNIQALDDSFRDKYFQGSGHKDHAHLNKQGHELFFPVAEDFILKHLNDNKR